MSDSFFFYDKPPPNTVAYNNKHLFSHSQVCDSDSSIFILDPGLQENSYLGPCFSHWKVLALPKGQAETLGAS